MKFGEETSLMAQVVMLSAEEGYLPLHWQRFCASAKRREEIKALLDGEAVITRHVNKPKRPPSAKQQIIRFYQEVFGLGQKARAVLKGTPAFKPDGKRDRFDLILSQETLPDGMIIEKLALWKPDMPETYLWDKMEDIQPLPKGHERPQGSYLIRHQGGAEPDSEHLDKSYNDAMAEKITFLTYREYLIASIRNLWEHEVLFDVKGSTHTSSVWSGGYLVYSDSYSGQLRLYDGYRDRRYTNGGPRTAEIL
jgi:hypothetical protein